MKTQKLLELERERLALRQSARDKLDELRAALEGGADEAKVRRLEREHDEAMHRLSINDLDQDEERERARLADENRAEREARRPGSSGSIAADDDPAGTGWLSMRADASGWQDESGQPVRVLAPGDAFARERAEGVALGDAVRAMVTGARNDFERRALSEGTGSAGGFTVPTPLAGAFIDRLRARSVVNRAGARTVPMDSQTLAMARVDGDPTVAWRAESASIALSDPTFARVVFTAKSLSCIVKTSRELLADSSNAGAIIEDTLAKAMALELDRAAIWGSGSGAEPTGVANMAGINSVSMGTNGAALDSYDKLLDALYELELDNVDQVTAGIYHPRTKLALAKLRDADNNPLVPPQMAASVPLLATTAAPINETQGTATNASSLIYGDFRRLMIGLREQINIRVLSELYAGTGEVGILVHMRADVQAERTAAFCRLAGIIPA